MFSFWDIQPPTFLLYFLPVFIGSSTAWILSEMECHRGYNWMLLSTYDFQQFILKTERMIFLQSWKKTDRFLDHFLTVSQLIHSMISRIVIKPGLRPARRIFLMYFIIVEVYWTANFSLCSCALVCFISFLFFLIISGIFSIFYKNSLKLMKGYKYCPNVLFLNACIKN